MAGRPTCYFAHHITDYDTEREQMAVALIESHGFAVVNPNTPEDQIEYKKRGMQHFTERALGCTALAFQRFPEGQIGAGVAKEIGTAIAGGKAVYEVTDEELVEFFSGALSVDDTRALLKEIRAEKANEVSGS